jgi:hypothetical protein
MAIEPVGKNSIASDRHLKQKMIPGLERDEIMFRTPNTSLW